MFKAVLLILAGAAVALVLAILYALWSFFAHGQSGPGS